MRKGLRVTLYMGPSPSRKLLQQLAPGQTALQARLVVPSEPREVLGQYWGYSTRIASSLQDVFSKSPFPVRALHSSRLASLPLSPAACWQSRG